MYNDNHSNTVWVNTVNTRSTLMGGVRRGVSSTEWVKLYRISMASWVRWRWTEKSRLLTEERRSYSRSYTGSRRQRQKRTAQQKLSRGLTDKWSITFSGSSKKKKRFDECTNKRINVQQKIRLSVKLFGLSEEILFWQKINNKKRLQSYQ